MTVEELRPVADDDHRTSSFTDRARSLLSSVGQDDRVKQAASVTREVAEHAQEASQNVSRKITQEDAWDELRSDVEELTEIARAHHALIVDLIDRVEALEPPSGIEPRAEHDG
jgi:DNA repair ATPase RecN